MFGNYEQLLLVKNYTSIGDSFMKNFVRLSEVCTISASKAYIEEEDAWLLNLDKVESKTGRVLEHEVVPKEKLNGSIVQFDTGNVLYSKLRPNLNKVVLPEKNGYATSEMLPLRPCESKLTKGYLAEYLRSDNFVSWAVGKTAGAKMPRLGTKVLMDKMIPLPPLEEQHKIVSLFSVVNHVISLRQQQLAKLDELVKVRFVEMFGDPVLNPYGFDKVPLSELAEIKIGPFGSLLHKEDYIEGGHPLLNPSHIVDGNIVPDKKLTISDEKYNELEAYHLHFGDVVMGRRGEMGRCAVVMGEDLLCGTGSLLIRTRGEVTADFIQKVISFPSFKKTIEDMAVGQTMPNLNVPIVSRFQVVKPPIDIQHRYYSFVGEVDNLKQSVQKNLDKLETLKKALMQKYFG